MPSPFSMALTLALTRLIGRLASEGEITPLEGVKFRGTRLYTQAFCHYSPPFPFFGLIDLHDSIGRDVCHLAELEDHEGIGWVLYRTDNGAYLGTGNAELGTQPAGEAGEVRPCLNIQV